MKFRYQYFIRRNRQIIALSLAILLTLFPLKVLSQYLKDGNVLIKKPVIQIANRNIADKEQYDILLEADELYKKGDFEGARELYKTVKPPMPEPALVNEAIYETDVQKLSGAMKVYWRSALDGFEKDNYAPIFVSLRLLTRQYPEFVPAYFKLVEACKMYQEACASEHYAEGDDPRTIVDILEQATTLYPDDPDLLKAKIEALDEAKNYLGASIAARQFSIVWQDLEPEIASEFRTLSDEYLKKYKRKVKQQKIGSVILSTITNVGLGVLRDNPRYGVSALQALKFLFEGEAEYGKRAATALVSDYKNSDKLREDQILQNYVDGIASRFVPFTGRDEFEFEFYVVEDSSLNAFALPGGKIFVNTGAILGTNSEAELAGIIAHEIAHAALSHGYLKVSQSLLLRDLSKVVPFLDMVSGFVNSQYSRELETQADIVGTRFLSKTNYAADGMRNFMVTLSKKVDLRRQLGSLLILLLPNEFNI
ncbi:MAG: M48 family metalloprotease [Microcoleaceae cyanobacterium]